MRKLLSKIKFDPDKKYTMSLGLGLVGFVLTPILTGVLIVSSLAGKASEDSEACECTVNEKFVEAAKVIPQGKVLMDGGTCVVRVTLPEESCGCAFQEAALLESVKFKAVITNDNGSCVIAQSPNTGPN